MKILILSTLILISLANTHYSQDLPNQMTDEETIIWQSYQHPANPLFTDPPPSPVRGMAEWEELQGIIITWRSYYSILSQIVDYAQEEGLVYIICNDSNSVKTYLQNSGVPLTNLVYLVTSSNSIWVRDYGPWTAYSNDIDTLNIIDWKYNRPRPLDDVTPEFFADYIDAPIYQTTTPPYNLTHSGGNLFVDGHGTAFSSKLILNENPAHTEAEIDTIMEKYLGIDRYIKMTTLPYDVIHHIDMHMKLLDEETLLVGEYPTGIADGPQIEQNLQFMINNFQTCFGREFKVVRIPMPPDANGHYPHQGGDYRTYTNSIIINKIVIIPTYELQYDTTAFRIYQEAMPGYNIVGINSNAIIPQLGAIHCIVKEVGAFDPVFISHAKMEGVVEETDSIRISAVIKSNAGIESASVYWTNSLTNGFQSIQMYYQSGDTLTASIPPQTDETKIYYYISATSNRNKTITKPITAPDGNYNFTVQNGVTNFEEGISPAAYSLSQNYPNPFNPSTKINYSLGQKSKVLIKVFDVLGKEAAVLVNDEIPEGNYTVEFDASNLPSGVYFYEYSAGSFSQTNKMLLLK